MKVTVGIATYGRPDDLARCLSALARQERAPDEVIVVDQAPSDRGRAVVADSGLPAARYLEQPPLGLSASRNLALREATGTVLAVTDDDCVPDAAWLAAIAAGLGTGAGAVTGPVRPPLGEPPPGAVAVSSRTSAEEAVYAAPVPPWRVGTGGNFAARVEVLRRHGGWDERLGAGTAGRAGEDTDLIYRLLRDGVRIRYAPRALVRHAWQTAARRHATRSSYAFGIGAMCGVHLARRDPYALRMLASYGRLHARRLAGGLRRRDRTVAGEHLRALASIGPGVAYGVRCGRRVAAA